MSCYIPVNWHIHDFLIDDFPIEWQNLLGLTFIEVAVLCQYAWSDLILPPIPTMYYAASWTAKKSDLIIHSLPTKIWGQISWGDSALEKSPHQGVIFLPGDSLLHLGRSKLSEVLFQSRHEVQQSRVKSCVVEWSFKPSDEVLTCGWNPNKFAQIVSLLKYSPQ